MLSVPALIPAETCDQEPIRIPGAIQPHGVLLVLATPDLRVIQASVNASKLTGREVIGRPVDDLIGSPFAALIRSRLTELAGAGRELHLGTIILRWGDDPEHRFDVIGHHHAAGVVLELESAGSSITEDFTARVNAFLVGLEGQTSVSQICDFAAREVRAISRFDRVLIYRFDAGWHSTVLAEDRNDRLPSFLGHRFPASDIPAQARELYCLIRSRIIPDASYTAVPLEPRDNPVTGGPLDMTRSVLRSVSPVHVEYMKSMGTAASMSFSIVRDGRLWGLVSCHHATPQHAPYAVRRSCELIAQVLSLQFAAAERQLTIEQRVRLRRYVSGLLAAMTEADDFLTGLTSRPDDLLAVAGAAGAAVVSKDRCGLVGRTPTEEQVRALGAWLEQMYVGRQVVRIDDLEAQYPAAADFVSEASGLLAVQIATSTESYIMWFRPEMVETVVWAGRPEKAVMPGGANGMLGPRTSFEAWKQVVRGNARPWTDYEEAAVTELQADAVTIVLRGAEAKAELSAELERSNRELEAFAYSVSHDLRAPFRHIVGYAQLLRDNESEQLSERGRRYAGIVVDAARDAGRLIDNLLAFSQMGRASLHPMRVELDKLVAEVRDEVMAAEGAGRVVAWEVDPLPAVTADLSMLRLAVRNLLSNAVKYSGPRGERAKVRVRRIDEPGAAGLEVIDNGVGFDMQYADKLFGVFQRLHRMEEFEGTGIGLANVRRIVERHGGRVWAEGRLGEGATFGLTLPASAAGREGTSAC